MFVVAACVAVSHTLAAIGFPILIILLIPLRILVLPQWFSLHELQTLDDFTATNKEVLASLGGAPVLPGGSQALERRQTKAQQGVARQRAGELHL